MAGAGRGAAPGSDFCFICFFVSACVWCVVVCIVFESVSEVSQVNQSGVY